MTATLKKSPWMASDALLAMGSGLAEKLTSLGLPAKPNLLVRALHELLDGQDDSARDLRMAMQIHLARESNGFGRKEKAPGVTGEDMLSTEEAAQLMDCSRPYVAMLIDAEKLLGAIKSKGGHRKVPKSAVLQWIEATKAEKGAEDTDKDYRQAAVDAGMYSIPDEAYAKASKRGV